MLSLTTFLLVLVLADAPERKGPPAKEELAAITRRGRDLAGYDAAAWHASDAVMETKPKTANLGRYIARKTDSGWTVAFGRLDEEHDKFLVAVEATQGKDPVHFDVKSFDPPREETGFLRASARAMDVVLKDFAEHFEGPRRPYNIAFLPAHHDRIHVYLVPAPTKPGVWPLGGDVRYLMSPDGRKIVEKHPMHRAIIEAEPPKPTKDFEAAMGFHTHVLDDAPEDSDVFHVLTRKPAVPEMIATRQFVFQVAPDGEITYVGKAEDVLKKR